MVTSRADLVANQRGDRPRNRAVTNRMPASVHSLADATRKPNENVDAVIRHYKAINNELEAQLAVALAQRDAWRELAEHCWQYAQNSSAGHSSSVEGCSIAGGGVTSRSDGSFVDAERKRWFE